MPIFDTTALVVNPDTLQPLPPGDVGEILLDGPQLLSGYHGNPEANDRAFVTLRGRRFFRTGDLGRVDQDGYFFIVDRLKRMINASGYKVWPAEVESHLCAHPSVLQACVIGCRHPLRGESVKALVVLRPGKAIAAAELIAWSRDRMAAYKTPQLVEFMDALPMNAAGKIEWRRLEERELTLTPSTPPPSTEPG